ncbi:MAG: Rpn family recombination-promoting nuclease/putative transposase [Planctomycetota bacterium JB042]
MEPTVHDRFARRAFSDPDVMRGHLRAFLPSAIAGRLDLERIRREPDTLIGSQLSEKIPDLVFSAPVRGGGVALARFLFLHQSRPARDLAYDLFAGSARLLEAWRRNRPREKSIPWVVPVVLYAGPRRFRAPRRLAALAGAVDEEDVALAVGPDLTYVLNDLTRVRDGELRTRCGETAYQALAHLLLKHAWDDDVLARLREWGDLLVEVYRSPTGLGALRSVLSYVLGLEVRVTAEDVGQVLVHRLESHERALAMTTIRSYADELRAEGHAEGFAQGREQGRVQGLETGRREEAAAMLLRLLDRRFDVPGALADRIDAASLADLDRWFDRALDAERLEDVFVD